jgi:UDP-N-acetylglucosamine diphosphorylase / glucose-1-phosphate thymidylyltransferase / UDP-N-acetylgalactosamine diphosphorylase / glucosamine-1-phosphate N-acetyltransferase / galactosamine-1-phosphate N-acetyltransferase
LDLIFTDSTNHHLQKLVGKPDSCLASSLKLLGKLIIVRNIDILSWFFRIKTIRIPDKFPQAIEIIKQNFPSINTEDYRGADNYSNTDTNGNHNIHVKEIHPIGTGNFGTIPLLKSESHKITIDKNRLVQIPIDFILYRKPFLENEHVFLQTFNMIIYPWDFLRVIQEILFEEVKETRVSPNASVAKSCIIEGPCIIEDGVRIDDFAKIKGPTYIGKDSFIGMGSLVRNCMLENKTRIGFNCEIGKSYFAGNDKISHHNVILDSIIGENVWFGGYSGTANVLLDRQNVKYRIDDTLVNTGMDHFGAIVGNNSAVGASVIILPGRKIQPSSTIQAGTIVGKDY